MERSQGSWGALVCLASALFAPSPALGEPCPQTRCEEAGSPGALVPSCCIFGVPDRLPTLVTAAYGEEGTLLLGTAQGEIWSVEYPSLPTEEAVATLTRSALAENPLFDPMHPEVQVLHLRGEGDAFAATRGQVFARRPEGDWELTGVVPDVAQGALWVGTQSYLLGGSLGLYCVGLDGRGPKGLPFRGLPGPHIGALASAQGSLYLGLWRGGVLHLPIDADARCGGLSETGVAWLQSPLPFASRASVTALLSGKGLVGLGTGGVLQGIEGLRPFMEPDVRRDLPQAGGGRPYDPVIRLLAAPGGAWLIYADRVLQLDDVGGVVSRWDGPGGLDTTSTLGAVVIEHPRLGPALIVGQSALLPAEPSGAVVGDVGEPGDGRSLWLALGLLALAGLLFYIGRNRAEPLRDEADDYL